jgi:phosphate:Na+ symporter
MLMSFVRAKLLSFRNSLGIVLGAAIGSTITVQLISFNLFDYALPAVALGFIIYISGKKNKTQAVGLTALGFGFVFFGMKIMSDQMAPLKSFPFFQQAVNSLSDHPVWAMIFSGLFTAAAQSSGATLGIILSLARTDLISLNDAIPMFFGASIGTCFTGITGSFGVPVEAKRVAYAHLVWKVIGALAFLPFIQPLANAGNFLTMHISSHHLLDGDYNARAIANTFTLYVTLTAVLALPFVSLLERFTLLIVPDLPAYASGETRPKYLDLNMRDTPELAMGSARREISRMGRFVEEMMRYIDPAITQKDEKVLEFIRQRDNKVDRLNREITHYLTDLTKRSRNEEDSRRTLDLLYVVSDLESIGDIIDKNLVHLAEKMIVHDYDFSSEGRNDLRMLHQKVSERLSEMVIALTTGDSNLANEVITGFEVLQNEGKRLHLRHLQRLQNGLRESIETSSVHLDAINYFLRIDYLIFDICLHIAGKAKQPVVIDMSE